MKCRFCVDALIRVANKNPDPQQGLSELRVAIDKLPEAVTAAQYGAPHCLYHYVKGINLFSSPIQKLLEAEGPNG